MSGDRSALGAVDCASGDVTIGRGEGCTLVIHDDKISRTHARVQRRGEGWRIIDEDSTNGVFCNDRRVQGDQRLEDGDRIRVGNTIMLFFSGLHVSQDDVLNSMRAGALLPFPLAILRPLVGARPPSLARARAAIEAIDIALRYAAGALIASSERKDEALAAFREALGDVPRWGSVVLRLAEIGEGGPMSEVAEGLSAASARWNGQLIPLHEAVARVDELRVEIAPAALDGQAFPQEDLFVSELLNSLILALRPLMSFSLVSRDQIENFDGEEIQYSLIEHRGSDGYFRPFSMRTRERLDKDWCYLHSPSGGMISLAPFLRYGPCAVCRRRELAFLEGVAAGPSGVVAKMRSFTTHHRSDVMVPKVWDALLRRAMTLSDAVAPVAAGAAVKTSPPPDPEKTNPEHQAFQPSRVLFLAASPRDLPDIDPNAEKQSIELALYRGAKSAGRLVLVLEAEDNLRAQDLQGMLNDKAAKIVHVSAHGSAKGEMYLLKGSSPIAVQPEDWAAAFAAIEPERRPLCVVLSACFSDKVAKLLAPHVGCIVGMSHQIGVGHAREFSARFYECIAAGQTVKTAFNQGLAQIGIVEDNDASDALVPRLTEGLRDPDGLRLVRVRGGTMDER